MARNIEMEQFLDMLYGANSPERIPYQPKQKHYGFGMPKHWSVIDANSGSMLAFVEHKDMAVAFAEQKQSENMRVEIRAMWM